MRKIALEVRLQRYRAAADVPGAIGKLRFQQELAGALASRIRGFQSAAFLERCKRLTGGIGVARERRGLRPSAIRPLLRDQGARGGLNRLFPRSRPAEGQQPESPVLRVLRLRFLQPRGRRLHRFFICGSLRLDPVKLQSAKRNGRHLDLAGPDGRAVGKRQPASVG